MVHYRRHVFRLCSMTHDALKLHLQEVFPSAGRKRVYGNATHNEQRRAESNGSRLAKSSQWKRGNTIPSTCINSGPSFPTMLVAFQSLNVTERQRKLLLKA
ncbi:hypothetical protein ILYODFUR_035840 [Ilyodon furcidens]|uniref:Uncharacterized protein n=1 Tax=Ilyodon furcidens TaxID=33524 RepID=A0ABV0VKJ8_9TELE